MARPEKGELAEWIEPAIGDLDMAETETFPNRGGDGMHFAVDCTAS